ncbi:hypothetical protein AARAC_009023 [Aspergillus arachidicola]|uniref:Uncharacterized protein n=1 Tax=Aspergillus arachidicola TaxID=656916 RepID=A0A2G7EMJ6_9EURO|nr:hypothetical protein AARAC_009023 [Aspergillus arachidicola]
MGHLKVPGLNIFCFTRSTHADPQLGSVGPSPSQLWCPESEQTFSYMIGITNGLDQEGPGLGGDMADPALRSGPLSYVLSNLEDFRKCSHNDSPHSRSNGVRSLLPLKF